MEEIIICRICLENINGQYIKPCYCSSGNYHIKCLEKWILTKEKLSCEVCLSNYKGIYLKYILHSYYLFNSIMIYLAVLSACEWDTCCHAPTLVSRFLILAKHASISFSDVSLPVCICSKA